MYQSIEILLAQVEGFGRKVGQRAAPTALVFTKSLPLPHLTSFGPKKLFRQSGTDRVLAFGEHSLQR